MAKFCYKCGNELKEGVKFCAKCGTQVKGVETSAQNSQNQDGISTETASPVTSGTETATPGTEMPTSATMTSTENVSAAMEPETTMQMGNASRNKLPKNTMIWLGAAAVVIVALVFGGIKLFGAKPYEEPWTCLEKGINNRDMKLFFKAFPKDQETVLTSAMEIYSQFGGDEGGFSALIAEELEGAKVHFEVTDAEKVKKSELKEELSESGVSDKQLAKIDAAYIVDVECTAQYKGETESKEASDVPVVKIDGRWCLPIDLTSMTSFDGLF